MIFIHGGPGVGKSFFASQVIDRVGLKMTCCGALTGIAASALPNGRTLHDLLGLPIKGSHTANLPPLPMDKAARLAMRLQDVKLIIIDELSMIDNVLFSRVNQRLQQLRHNSLPFGGLGVILMGDFLQLPPIFGKALYKSALDGSTQGGLLFRKFALHSFVQQMRAADDAEHTLNIDLFRTNPFPVTPNFLKSLRPLTALDVNQDPSWKDAQIVVTNNAERLSITKVQVIRFSKSRSIPIVSWRQPLSASSKLSDEDRNVLYENIDELTGWFLCGAPAHLTTNVNPAKHLANGTEVVLHSLCLSSDVDGSVINEQLKKATPGTIVTLPSPPTSVNVIVQGIRVQDWPGCQSLVDGSCVIPLKLNKRPESLARSDGRMIKYHDFGYSLAFSVTYHKIQGKTVNKLILDLNKNPMSSLSLQSLYVGISRVRRASDLRILPPLSFSNIGWTYLKGLHHNKDYTCWSKSYKDHMFTGEKQSDTKNTTRPSATAPIRSTIIVSTKN